MATFDLTTPDGIAEGFQACLNAAHEQADALPPGALRRAIRAGLKAAHSGADVAHNAAAEAGLIQPLGGGPKE